MEGWQIDGTTHCVEILGERPFAKWPFAIPMKEGERSLDLFKLFGTVIVETKEAIDALDEASDAAKETSDSIGDVGTESKKSGKTAVDSMKPVPSKFAAVAKAGAAVVSAVVAIGTAMVALAENTREYRLEMGKLETAFDSAGHTTEAATETYQTLYSILGETDRAVEAAQHIAKLCETEEDRLLSGGQHNVLLLRRGRDEC